MNVPDPENLHGIYRNRRRSYPLQVEGGLDRGSANTSEGMVFTYPWMSPACNGKTYLQSPFHNAKLEQLIDKQGSRVKVYLRRAWLLDLPSGRAQEFL